MSLRRDEIRSAILATGAVAVGFADADSSQQEVSAQLSKWISKQYNAGMSWMNRHAELRKNLNNILPGVRSVISVAFPYIIKTPTIVQGVAQYAHFYDYHYSLREALEQAIHGLMDSSSYRICIDSAPIGERYWAVRSGIAIRGDNGSAIVPGVGCEVFLAEILTTEDLSEDSENNSKKRESIVSTGCLHCGRCMRECPTGALQSNGEIDSRRCLSYLTIEHRGYWQEALSQEAMGTEAGRHTLFGCDACITCCPMNQPISIMIEQQSPLRYHPGISKIKQKELPTSKGEFKRVFKGSPIQRCSYEGWLRNLQNLQE